MRRRNLSRSFFGRLAALCLSTFVGLTGVVHAIEFKAYSDAAFAQAKADGLPVIVDAHADWCPTCAKQQAAFAELSRNPAFDKVVIFKLDYDSEKDAKRALGIQKQSTLIAFRGDAERDRAVGVTDPAKIASLLNSALK